MTNATPFPAPNSWGWWRLYTLAALATLAIALVLVIL